MDQCFRDCRVQLCAGGVIAARSKNLRSTVVAIPACKQSLNMARAEDRSQTSRISRPMLPRLLDQFGRVKAL
eukprot:209211-Pyramimonas_sp.AAC.1